MTKDAKGGAQGMRFNINKVIKRSPSPDYNVFVLCHVSHGFCTLTFASNRMFNVAQPHSCLFTRYKALGAMAFGVADWIIVLAATVAGIKLGRNSHSFCCCGCRLWYVMRSMYGSAWAVLLRRFVY